MAVTRTPSRTAPNDRACASRWGDDLVFAHKAVRHNGEARRSLNDQFGAMRRNESHQLAVPTLEEPTLIKDEVFCISCSVR